jgi:hypothetical protein
MLRYSLRTLGAAVTAIAIGCAALLNANHWVASTAWTLVFMVLSLASIAAVLTRRGFWTGFAIAGWLYLLVGIGPLSGYHNGNLLTTAALQWGAKQLPKGEQHVLLYEQGYATQLDYATFVRQILVAPQLRAANTAQLSLADPSVSFVSIGQSLWTLLLALIGGRFGAFVMAKHRPARTE